MIASMSSFILLTVSDNDAEKRRHLRPAHWASTDLPTSLLASAVVCLRVLVAVRAELLFKRLSGCCKERSELCALRKRPNCSSVPDVGCGCAPPVDQRVVHGARAWGH
jgi:hypothetical protein